MKQSFKRGAKRFAPHKFDAQVSLLGDLPVILIAKAAYDRMYYIVDESPEEVSWLGTVRREGLTFLIEEVFIFDQECHAAQTAMDQESVGAFFTELASQPDGIEKANAIRFWGHSHVHMAVNPSGTYTEGAYGDLACMHSFGKAADWFIMGICNKKGEFRFEIFFYTLGFKIQDVEWQIYESEQAELRQQVKAELSAKVRKSYPHSYALDYQSGQNWQPADESFYDSEFGQDFLPVPKSYPYRLLTGRKKGGQR